MRDYLAQGANANGGGRFAASMTTGEHGRVAAGHRRRRCSAPTPAASCSAPNMTTLTLRVHPRAWRGRSAPGDEIVGDPSRPRLQRHALAARGRRRGRDDPCSLRSTSTTGRLDVAAVADRIGPTGRAGSRSPGRRTRSARSRTSPAIVDAAHAARGPGVRRRRPPGARTGPIDIAALGCDALATSPYKWYGPHAGVLWLAPDLRDRAHPVQGAARARHRARALRDRHPVRTRRSRRPPPRPSSCSTEGMDAIAKAERRPCSRRCSTACSRSPTSASTGPRTSRTAPRRCASRSTTGTRRRGRRRARRRAGRGVGWQLLRGRGHGRARPGRAGGAIRAGVSCYTTAGRRRSSARRGDPAALTAALSALAPSARVRSDHDRDRGADGMSESRGVLPAPVEALLDVGARRRADRRRRARPAGHVSTHPAVRRPARLHDVRGPLLAQAAPHQGEPEGRGRAHRPGGRAGRAVRPSHDPG